MSVAAARPSTSLDPTFPPFSLKASFSWDFSWDRLALADLAFSTRFFSRILAMLDFPRGAALKCAASLGASLKWMNEGNYWFAITAFAQHFSKVVSKP
jgi:hypothetical protein